MLEEVANAARRLVGAKPTDPVASARSALERATAERETHAERLSAAERAYADARAEFDADGSDGAADQVLSTHKQRDRAALFVGRCDRAIALAQEAIRVAEQGVLARELDEEVLPACDAANVVAELRKSIASHGVTVDGLLKIYADALVLELKVRKARSRRLELEQQLGRDTTAAQSELNAQHLMPDATQIAVRLVHTQLAAACSAAGVDVMRFSAWLGRIGEGGRENPQLVL